ncbi:acyltransferase [Williamsia maris]|uniref:Peptidoglycan/LPS O-acetylase OafA/YrhL, contains acyltransferase and SGNH-hydrolase domains n=1 Tax=Williamsia maris TaxID=72806 RepID=A0ABT1HCW9_9NOCA|nr:Peptidoglycan/LPS O-acetylase OafA/YrhL, contains acyltransferase and SGNH-hydrolase domains [Williamsia maris]
MCATHAAFWTGNYTDDLAGRFFARLEIGVAIFFVLSGYLLFKPWMASLAAGTRRPSVRRYAEHRARRILPAYWVTVLAVYAIFAWWRTDTSDLGQGWSGLLRNLTLTQIYGYGHLHSGLTQMWSLAAEVGFYVVLPIAGWLIVSAVCRGRWRLDLVVISLVVLGSVSPLWAIVTHTGDGLDPTARLWPPAFLTWFVGGMLLAALAQTRLRINPLLSVLIAVLAFQVSCTSIAGEPTITPLSGSATVIKLLLYLVVALGLIAPLVLGPAGSWWDRLMGSRPMVWLGEISYEFFLVHLMVVELVMDLLGYTIFTGSMVGVLIVTSVLSIPVAWLLHRLTAVFWRPRTTAPKPESVPSIP